MLTPLLHLLLFPLKLIASTITILDNCYPYINTFTRKANKDNINC
jgi:hypothetical protein